MTDITQYIMLLFLVLYIGVFMYMLSKVFQVIFTVSFAKWLTEKAIEVAKE